MIKGKFFIAFKHYQHEKNNLQNQLMKALLRSEFIHCELVFSDGKVGSSNQFTGVNIFAEDQSRNPFYWEFYEIPWYYEVETRKYVVRKVGKPYNWGGVLGSMLYPIGLSQDGFCCADLCYVALCKSGVPLPNHDPESVSPNDLRLMIQKLYPRIYDV